MSDLRSAPAPPIGADDHLRGDPGWPAVILYADFTCPRCALAHARLRDEPLRVAFRHFAIAAKHPRAVALACAAEAAGLQGRFWELHDALFADPARIDDPGELRPEAAPATFSWATQDVSRTGIMGDARAATAEKGMRWLESGAAKYAGQIADLCRSGKRRRP